MGHRARPLGRVRPTEKHSDRIAWLEHCLGYLKSQQAKNPIQDEIEALKKMAPQDLTDEIFDPLYTKLLAHFQETSEDEADHGIANLTLLDEHTNRSYKNAVFAVKRQRLLSLDQAGIFVPLLHPQRLPEMLQPEVDNAMLWGREDRAAYQSTILETLVGFFSGRMKGAP